MLTFQIRRGVGLCVAIASLLLLLGACRAHRFADAEPEDFAVELAAMDSEARSRLLADLSSERAESVSAALRELGEDRDRQDDIAGAEAAFLALWDLAASRSDLRGQSTADLLLGRLYGRRGHYTTARPFLEAAVASFRSLEDQANLGVALNNLGIVLRHLARPGAAVPLYREALELEAATVEPARMAARLHNLGTALWETGDLDRAYDALSEAQALKQRSGVSDVSTAMSLALVLEDRGDPQTAEQILHDVLTRAEPSERVVALNNLGRLLAQRADLEGALAVLGQGLELAEAADNPTQRLYLIENLAATEIQAGRANDAVDRLTAALAREQSSAAVRPRLFLRLTMSRGLLALGRVPESIDAARSAIDEAMAFDAPGVLWQAWTILGTAEQQAGNLEGAVEAFTKAVAVLEGWRGDLAAADHRSTFLDRKVEPYHRLLLAELARGADAAALHIAERSRARTLVELLLASSPEGNDEHRWGARGPAEDRVAELRLRIGRATSEAERGRLAADLAAAQAALPAIETGLPATAVVPPNWNPPEPPVDTALVAFSVTAEATWVWVRWSSEPGRWIEIPLAEEALRVRVETFRRALGERSLAAGERAAALGRELLGPLPEAVRKAKAWVVVPDGPLWDLPVAALVVDGAPVVANHVVTVAPSLHAYQILQQRPAMGGRGVLVVTGEGEAEQARFESSAAAISDLYADSRVTTARPQPSSPEVVLQALGAAPRVVHLMAHATIDPVSPAFSAIQLSPDGTYPEGRLEARTLAHLDLRSVDLVVLAVCESGRGRIGRGEGTLGFAWSLLSAGVRTVVVSQWRVEAQSTAALMQAFHRRVTMGETDVAAALREAMLEVGAQRSAQHPFYWAGFAAVGAGRLGSPIGAGTDAAIPVN